MRGSSQERTKMEVGGGRLAIKKRLGCARPKVVSHLKTPKMEIRSRNYILRERVEGENAIDPDSKFRRTPPFGNDNNNNNTGNRCQKGNQIAVIKIGATENGKNMQFPEKKKKDFVFFLEVFFVWENDGCGARKDRYIPISSSTLAPSSVSSRTQKIANPDYYYGSSLLPFQGPSLPTSLKSALKNPTSNLPQK